jgi:hypothetical protein
MRIDLSAPVTWETAKATATSFCSWWTEELRGLLPPAGNALLDRLMQRWTVTPEGPLWRLHRKGAEDLSVVLDTDEPTSVVREHIQRLEPGAFAARVEMALAPSDVLVRTVRLPASAAAHLRSVIQLQLDRLSPFPAENVRFDCRKIGEEDGDIEVEVSIVPLATLDSYQARLIAYGLRAGAFRSGAHAFRPSGTIWGAQQMIPAALFAGVLIIWIGVFLIAPIMRERELVALAIDVARLRAPAQSALAERDEVDRLTLPAKAVADEIAKPDLLEAVRALTLAVPDDTHLTELSLDTDRCGFTAIGPDAGHVLAGLDRVAYFGKSRVVSAAIGSGSGFVVEAKLSPSVDERAP